MKAAVLFSGGKDSALAALFLSRDYDVELNTFVFDPHRDRAAVIRAAEALCLPLQMRTFRPGFLAEVTGMIEKQGFPNDAINRVHREAIAVLAGEYGIVGDGIRLNDRVPMLSPGEVQRLESTCGCSYVRPLLGFGKPEIQRLAGRYLDVRYGETGEIDNGDYESEIRQALARRGLDPVSYFPPRHQQSLVIGRVNIQKHGDKNE
jgi:predicted subunit of tRNA(5-methylaminomethyl-2-thiouridylate) methyltransferase